MTIWILSLASVAVISLVSLVGLGTLSLNLSRVRKLATWLVSLTVGTLLGSAFIHLIPETFATTTASMLQPSLLVLAGILLFFVVEKLLPCRGEPLHQRLDIRESNRPELVGINIIGDGIHNFIDGVLIGASYLVSPTLGISTTIAVLLHEIPQELGDFGIRVHSGLHIHKAILLNLASASVAIIGTIVTLDAGTTGGMAIITVIVPITAGGFVHIAAADLIPDLQRDRSFRRLLAQASLIALGMALMAVLTVVE